MRNTFRHRLGDERGFTLVELLVIVLIVAILAAIALPAFLSQRAKSQDAEAKWMAAVTAQALIIYHQDHDTFAGATPADLGEIEPTVRDARGVQITGTLSTYRIEVESASGSSGGGPFVIEYRPSGSERTCTVPSKGGCPDDGRW
jgi:type IV pilus assembly protein PilA